MSSVTVQAFPLDIYPEGVTDIPETPIDDSINVMRLAIDRATSQTPDVWADPAVSITMMLDWFDGAQWTDGLFFFSDSGGIRNVKGMEMPQSYAEWPLPPGIGRKIRGQMIISGGAANTAADLTVEAA